MAFHLNDMKIPETKRFIPKGFELGTTLSYPNISMITPTVNIGLRVTDPKDKRNFQFFSI